MKTFLIIATILLSSILTIGQTQFTKTTEQFKNKEFVWNVVYNDKRVGEFWPIHGLHLITKETDPTVFTDDLADSPILHRSIATAPDGMTKGGVGGYIMEGKSLSQGRQCGDGNIYNYGIVVVDATGFNISFTHKKEIDDFDALYNATKKSKGSLFFLPSIYRNGNQLNSTNQIDKVIINRWTLDGEQIGVIVFDEMVTYNEAVDIVKGLDRNGKSETKHIYVLDGGVSWGQCAKNINNQIIKVGTRSPEVITNYLVFY